MWRDSPPRCGTAAIAVVHVATSLLAMVDAAIGGKTGVNLPEGKNLVGAFWQPSGVICDVDALTTLPPRERRSGDGEMAKYHFLTGDDLDAMPLDERIARCVEIKAAVVAADEREDGRRAVLNYGHTLAHALETSTGHAVTHGEAVGIGLVYAAELAAALGRVDAERVAAHRAVVGSTYSLPTTIPDGPGDDELLAADGARQEGARRTDVRARRATRRRGRRRHRPDDRPRRARRGALSRLDTVGARDRGLFRRQTSAGASPPTRAALDGRTMVLSHATNIRWLTGFGGSLAWVVIDDDRLVLLTDGRYAERAAADLAANGLADGGLGTELEVRTKRPELVDAMVAAASATGAPVLAEAEHLSHAAWTPWPSDSRSSRPVASSSSSAARRIPASWRA